MNIPAALGTKSCHHLRKQMASLQQENNNRWNMKLPGVMTPGGLWGAGRIPGGKRVTSFDYSIPLKSRKFYQLVRDKSQCVAAGCSLKRLTGAGVCHQVNQGSCAEWEQGRWRRGNYRLENNTYFIYHYMEINLQRKPNDVFKMFSWWSIH